jgi:hypothetical protein
LARHVQHKAIIGTEAARHLERIDQFGRAGHAQGDDICADSSDLKAQTKARGPMARKFDKAFGPQLAPENETRPLMHRRRPMPADPCKRPSLD